MFRRIDQSSFLLRFLQSISGYFARRRGLLIVIGAFLVLIGFVLELVNFFVDLQIIGLLEIIVRNVGILMALVGLLIIRPLGSS